MSDAPKPGESGVYHNFLFDPAQAERLFNAANDLAERVDVQNASISRLEEFEDKDIRALVQAGLADSQAETMAQLEKAGDRAPYAAVGEKSLKLSAIVDGLRQDKARADAYIGGRKAKLEQSIVAGEEIAGKELPELRLLVAQSIAKLPEVIEQQYPGLEDRLAEAMNGLSIVEALFDVVKPWPLPQVRYPKAVPNIVIPEPEAALEPEKPLQSLPYPSYSHAGPEIPVRLQPVDFGVPEFVQPPPLPPEPEPENNSDEQWNPLIPNDDSEFAAAKPETTAEPDEAATALRQERKRDAALVSPSKWLVTALLMEPNKIWTHRNIAKEMLEAGVYGDASLAHVEGRVRNMIGAKVNGRRVRAKLMQQSMSEEGSAPTADIQRGTCRTPGAQLRPHQVYRVLELTEANRRLMAEAYEEPQDDGTIITWEQTPPLEDQ